MTIVRDGSSARLVECPFCGEDLRDRQPHAHLQKCDEFRRAFDMDPIEEGQATLGAYDDSAGGSSHA